MRIIAGERKGQPLKAVPGMNTRPTTDKVKEAIFNMIGPYFSGGICLDLYAGSGALGLEALSRGVERAIFIDHDKKAIETIRKNIEACRFESRTEVYRNQAKRALKALFKRKLTFTYVFLDPPYARQQLVSDIEELDRLSLLAFGSVIVCEHGRDDELPRTIGRVIKIRQETYGETKIAIFRYELKEDT